MPPTEHLATDILIVGAGGAGLLAALHAHRANPDLDITIAVKGLLGKSGCTRMVQGGYNVALANDDSVERHFMDTIEGGKWLPDQELAWTLVNGAIACIHELENAFGCYFDRNPDGTLHQKAFAGQSFDRTVHKGDLTGIEIMNRLMEQVHASGVNKLEEHRALALIPSGSGDAIAGALLVDVRTGAFRFVQAKAVMLAAGGGPTMYRYHTPSGEKSCDGMAMALAAGLRLRDMEMVQFHPTGLLAGEGTRLTGTIIEEGLRGVGGHLLNGKGNRFMDRYDPAGERATRDIVSRAMIEEVNKGNGTANGGLYISMAHLGPENVRSQFKGMVKRCADVGFDLAGGLVEVLPTAHYMMGGIMFETNTATKHTGLYVAGEDSGGVHGANRLGGNGVANSTVFGGVAGDTMAEHIAAGLDLCTPNTDAIEAAQADALAPFDRPAGRLNELRNHLQTVMWEDVGIIRDGDGIARAQSELDALAQELEKTGLSGNERAFNLTWQDHLNLRSQILVSSAICAAAGMRNNSRGAHHRNDFPETDDLATSWFTQAEIGSNGKPVVSTSRVEFTRVTPGSSLLDGRALEQKQ